MAEPAAPDELAARRKRRTRPDDYGTEPDLHLTAAQGRVVVDHLERTRRTMAILALATIGLAVVALGLAVLG
jgi:hypothetical protein